MAEAIALERNRIMTEFKEHIRNNIWPKVDTNKDNFVDVSELKDLFDQVGFKLAPYKIRLMVDEFVDKNRIGNKDKLTYNEFEILCMDLKSKDVGLTFKSTVTKKENLETSMADDGITHSVSLEEKVAFTDWINKNLIHDKDLGHLLPINSEGTMLYTRMEDGILLCKIVNHSCPDTIDERAINKKNLTVYTKFENLTLALVSSQAIGCSIVNIDAHDLTKGKPHLVLGLLWQIIRIGLFSHITLESCPGLARLLDDGESIEDLKKLSPELLLIRWVNYHLQKAGVSRRCSNFHSDIVDSEIYTHLMHQIAPAGSGVTKEALREQDLTNRAEIMLQQAEKLNCRTFVSPKDVTNGNYKLNLAFVANLFNNHPGLENPDHIEEVIEETREEKTYRNWMNSLGVRPYVNYLYSDLEDGLIIFQLYDYIKPGVVDWKRVNSKFTENKKFLEKLENCNYAVELGKSMGFSLVGISGQNINEGNQKLTQALIWQLMRAYTLHVLSQLANSGKPITEKEIVVWVNEKLTSAGKTSNIKGFQDASLKNAIAILDLIDAIKPGSVNYSLIRVSGTEEDNLANAKLAISFARKIGAQVYSLPEDITEVKHKMVMTVFACLMAIDYVPAAVPLVQKAAETQAESTTSENLNVKPNHFKADPEKNVRDHDDLDEPIYAEMV